MVGAGALLLTLNWLFLTRRTDSGLIHRRGLTAAWRSFRWFWFRIGLALFAWPHLVDVALGTPKAPVGGTAQDIVWQKGSATLHRYGNAGAGGAAVLVVHSLVSQPWILDLAPGRSMLEFMVAEGFDVYLLDWGDPSPGDESHGLSTSVDVLMDAEKEVLSRTERSKIHLVGYCLGGLICLARMGARTHQHIASFCALATPVDFGIPVALQPLISHRLFKPAFFLDASGCVPAPALRESFHVLRPQALRTVIGAWGRRNDREFRRFYDPLARWVWEHRPLAGQIFFDLVDLFRTNALFRENLVVAGEIVRLQDVRAPVLALIADRDHIVPSASSHALRNVGGPNVHVEAFDSGHVSMVSGSTARTTTWPRIAKWIRSNG